MHRDGDNGVICLVRGALIITLGAVCHGVCAAGVISFHDVTAETGITFVHTDGGCGKKYVVETVSAGLALFDYDNDGDVDIYFLNGAPLKDCKFDKPPKNALYRNDGNWKFTDVTDKSGLGDTGYGLGVAVGDFDNDGDADVFLNNDGPNVMYRNNGDGTFTDVTRAVGMAGDTRMGAGACFLDMDGDGDLDLYVANYLVFSYGKHIIHTVGGHPIYKGPPYYPPEPHSLWRNNGDGAFTDVSSEAGIARLTGAGMGMVCCDYDDDGDTDILVANDMGGNFLLVNDGKGRFEEQGLIAGFAFDIHGEEHGSMGVDCGDYDNDGLLDFYVTSYQGQFATLYRNTGDGVVEDATFVTGAGANTLAPVTWGNSIVDLDNDGWRDIFVACGHLQDNVELWDDTATYLTPNIVLQNTGGKFVDVSDKAGDGLKVRLSSRGAGFDDLDNDGDVDIVVLNSRRESTILRNDSTSQGRWLQLELRGTKTNRGGVGARVKVFAGDAVFVDEVHSGRGYQSHYGSRLYFGLGGRDKIDRIEVGWVGGATEVFACGAVDRSVTLTEGTGEPAGR